MQIHASENRDDADRVGRQAAVLLGVPYTLVHEGGLYKVRLGAFATDAEAGALRERAVRAGWPAAFRVREGP
ncbi:MAG: SPOR domain-containing protein [Bacteroidota bacterium]